MPGRNGIRSAIRIEYDSGSRGVGLRPVLPRMGMQVIPAMGSLDHLEELLIQAGKVLDQAADEIRNLGFSPEENIRRMIAETLIKISEIRSEIYKVRPDLKPSYFD